MEENQKQQQFLVSSVSELTSSSSSLFPKTEPVFARFSLDSGSPELRLGQGNDSSDVIVFNLQTSQLFKLGPAESLCISEASEANKQ
ncbi:hypothetical protein HAX54_029934, partial [Datura stramonium]|nr:hypothetical protein [Datura stramonium]